ncbi:MAG: phenylacetic acid degradation protein [Candidatus Entotheonella factor]|uniref:Phenylacetic acid degradation protein n=1 Tax=Entotheonella factor TaxID=1429438 RepID=W4LT27_ENTF1|nr:PaaI family thioesterase [Candidatus Entotheonella palauensis]ETX00592.1 MAG: phenylacetic acid degradation protein [Candidatus Entotheonella factor]
MTTEQTVQEGFKGLFPELLGIRILEANKALVKAEMLIRDDMCTLPGLMHGGAAMAFADTLGAVATMLNLPAGAGTTTIESKTNFLAGASAGERVIGECTPLHVGRTTMVWQTRILRQDGRQVAQVTQTQLVLQPRT